jgi:hypothetical protein
MVEDVREEGLAGATVSVQKTEQIRLVRRRSTKACPLARPMAVQRVTSLRVRTVDTVCAHRDDSEDARGGGCSPGDATFADRGRKRAGRATRLCETVLGRSSTERSVIATRVDFPLSLVDERKLTKFYRSRPTVTDARVDNEEKTARSRGSRVVRAPVSSPTILSDTTRPSFALRRLIDRSMFVPSVY